MTREEIVAKLFAILCENGRKIKNYPKDHLDSATLVSDLGLDSLDLMSTLFRIEEEFGVNIPEEDLKDHASVFGTLVTYIEKRCG